MTTLQQRYADRPVAGIVLFTDGQATDGESVSSASQPSIDWKQFGCPIYPVRIPSPPTLRDLRIASVSLRHPISKPRRNHGCDPEQPWPFGNEAIVELLDRNKKRIQAQTVQLNDKPGVS